MSERERMLRVAKREAGIIGPLKALGLGMSGAEDDTINKQMVRGRESERGNDDGVRSTT